MDEMDDTSGEKQAPVKPPKPKAAKTLPTDRMKVEKQLDMLRAFVAASVARGNGPVSIKEAAAVASVPESTPSLVTAFFLDVGLLSRVEGKYAPSQDAVRYDRATSWGQQNPASKLAPCLRGQWFSVALVPRVAFRALEVEEAISILAEEADAPKERRKQVEALLEYIVAAGLLVRDGTTLKAGLSENASNGDEEILGARLPPPPEDSHSQRTGSETAKSITLLSGGTLTITAVLDLFSLSASDRKFVFGLIDKLEEYPRESKPVVPGEGSAEQTTE
jgi:hypothetical protein